MNMKILITGARGMLAKAVRAKFEGENELILTDVREGVDEGRPIEKLDITDRAAVMEYVKAGAPDLIINCAAYTAVDQAEEQADLAYTINAVGPENLAVATKAVEAKLVHISTDYVFGGGLDTVQEYQEDDEKHPETAYGRTKLAGEEKIIAIGGDYKIFRTAWLYGDGPNFVRTMLSAGRERNEVNVVNDQYGSPTYAEDLADIIYQAIEKQIPAGVYNATNLGYTTWDNFTRKIYELAGIDCKVNGISSAEYAAQNAGKTTAKRPKNSKMSKRKLQNAGVVIPAWEDGLARYLEQELAAEKLNDE